MVSQGACHPNLLYEGILAHSTILALNLGVCVRVYIYVLGDAVVVVAVVAIFVFVFVVVIAVDVDVNISPNHHVLVASNSLDDHVLNNTCYLIKKSIFL